MTEQGQSRSNVSRQAATTEMLRRKVEVLREYVKSGIPSGAIFPTSINQLRNWEDQSLGLERIGSPSSTNRRCASHNTVLIDEAVSLINKLAALSKKLRRPPSSPLAAQIVAKDDDIGRLKLQVAVLTTQLLQVRHSNAVANSEVTRLTQRIKSLEETNLSLRQEVIRLTNQGLRPVK